MSIKYAAGGPKKADVIDKTGARIGIATGLWTPGDFPGSASRKPTRDHRNAKKKEK